MNQRKLNNPRSESSLNVTPLADVSLSLLLGFMVITPIIFQTLSATLPQQGSAGSSQVKPDPIIEYLADRTIKLNGKQVSIEQLEERLQALLPAAAEGSVRKVMFTGAGELIYDDVILLLDQLRGFGVEKIGFR